MPPVWVAKRSTAPVSPLTRPPKLRSSPEASSSSMVASKKRAKPFIEPVAMSRAMLSAASSDCATAATVSPTLSTSCARVLRSVSTARVMPTKTSTTATSPRDSSVTRRATEPLTAFSRIDMDHPSSDARPHEMKETAHRYAPCEPVK